ncbi:sal-like protein 1 [Melanaphis sacchari]|uniref:sal-like protein 1 n=1 Tax=Melanaphis sacchari TaxID=742174 RepID=UPI000DC14A2E|nr:sal-like protein 1 [Melanaphis sacchari]
MFKCEQCSSTFTRKGNLRVHEKKHNGIRFACTICPSTFGYKTNLKKHIKNIHGMINVPKPISAPRDVVDFCSDDDEICMKAMDDFEKNHDLTDNITNGYVTADINGKRVSTANTMSAARAKKARMSLVQSPGFVIFENKNTHFKIR